MINLFLAPSAFPVETRPTVNLMWRATSGGVKYKVQVGRPDGALRWPFSKPTLNIFRLSVEKGCRIWYIFFATCPNVFLILKFASCAIAFILTKLIDFKTGECVGWLGWRRLQLVSVFNVFFLARAGKGILQPLNSTWCKWLGEADVWANIMTSDATHILREISRLMFKIFRR